MESICYHIKHRKEGSSILLIKLYMQHHTKMHNKMRNLTIMKISIYTKHDFSKEHANIISKIMEKLVQYT